MRVFSELGDHTGGAFSVFAVAVAVAPKPPPPANVTVGEEQEVPISVMVNELIVPPETLAIAVAPLQPLIVTVGGEVYPLPAPVNCSDSSPVQ